MSKYNISEKTPKQAFYRTQVNATLMDELKEKILDIILIRHVKVHMNYTSFVNKFRIEEAMSLLADKRYASCNMEEISDMIGFSNRQSFYASFYKLTGMTPKQYKKMNYMKEEDKKK